MARITRHPILPARPGRAFHFTFDGAPVEALPGEMISSALFAAGIRVFGHHPKDGSAQGIFCANGQCAQCLVMADGSPVKACMTPARAGMAVTSLQSLPVLPDVASVPVMGTIPVVDVDVLIVGGGPAGLSAALELADAGVRALLIDDKPRLGGKLVLQTHRFFGSTDAVYAGTRGIEIGERLAAQVRERPSIDVWVGSTALAVFGDRLVGVLKGSDYVLVRPRILLVATGAREKALVFPGNTLPGVYGAGAFQTLVNRDLVKASDRLFIVGGGNVGLIAGYHALQAGIEVVGLVEALPECGGYQVHRDKLARAGVPIYTGHTILSANGIGAVESATIARVDSHFRPLRDTQQTFACDTVLIAVGLDPVDEFVHAARRFGLPVFAAGDADEIAEASAAIFSGRIVGRRIAATLGVAADPVPEIWEHMAEILKSRPGKVRDRSADAGPRAPEGAGLPRSAFPVFHCSQEIPCNPCTSVCPQGLIQIDESDIRRLPEFATADRGKVCLGCTKCVVVCPGLAITLVDARQDPAHPRVTLAHEFGGHLQSGDAVTAVDVRGVELGSVRVQDVKTIPNNNRTSLITVEAPAEWARSLAGVRTLSPWSRTPLPEAVEPLADTDIVCRCERVTAGEIRAWIREGHRDLNELKTLTRAGMGACGGKTCQALVMRLFREGGIAAEEITPGVARPLFVEVPLAVFAGAGPTGDSLNQEHDGGRS